MTETTNTGANTTTLSAGDPDYIAQLNDCFARDRARRVPLIVRDIQSIKEFCDKNTKTGE